MKMLVKTHKIMSFSLVAVCGIVLSSCAEVKVPSITQKLPTHLQHNAEELKQAHEKRQEIVREIKEKRAEVTENEL